MNQHLKQASQKASQLPEADQTRFARFLLAELEANRQWQALFSRPESENLLVPKADELRLNFDTRNLYRECNYVLRHRMAVASESTSLL